MPRSDEIHNPFWWVLGVPKVFCQLNVPRNNLKKRVSGDIPTPPASSSGSSELSSISQKLMTRVEAIET